ncbi:MAG: DNA polymerase III subunit beta [Ignavibacteriaceae bacterium]|jgi:DNA polymerase III, beta subunit|nr:MAG: DNA polymerase III subunit beta [Chlorobi bacterium OLB4]MBW7854706.1 DNA polymerase III subunit beta [Ignavibacteria bacterium]MEB2330164.1 DNA polymerase III subunit beta [Ignavibacteriaceae bacterium]OQY78227.1 MAG: DNA polymerase III subunit beta [Ignavibacteriales bacterium UTCHB1]
MKFQINSDNFVNALSKLSFVIPARTTHPQLNNILFKLEGNTLTLLATDLEIFIRCKLEIAGEADGIITIDAKKLIELTKTLPSENLIIETDDSNRFNIKTRRGGFTLPGLSADDFPEPEEENYKSKISIDGGILRSFFSKVMHATSSEELRRNMTGILIEINGDELRVVATDGFRLGKIVKNGFNHPDIADNKMIIPNKTSTLFMRLNNNNECEISYNENFIKFCFEEIEVFSRLIDDIFPNYDSVIPKDNDKTLKVLKRDLVDSLRRAEVIADNVTKRVKLDINSSVLKINSVNSEIGAEADESIECEFSSKDGSENFDENPFSIAFNAKYLLDCLQQIDSTEVKFTFSTYSKASIVYPTEKNDDTIEQMELVMPIRMG